MSRKKRVRAENSVHHIMCKSIKELQLFVTNQDKEYYLQLIKEVAFESHMEVLAYCLMDTHVHILLHPRGADIAKIMRKINNKYAKYYNRTHGREGHLFGERYKNIVMDDFGYLLRTSTYINNNAKDLPGYHGNVKDYPYCSIKDYIDPANGRGIANSTYVLSLITQEKEEAISQYRRLMEIQSIGEEAFVKEMLGKIDESNYMSIKETFKRNIDPYVLIHKIAGILEIEDENMIQMKYVKRYQEYRSIVAIALRTFCDMSLSQMAKIMKGQSAGCLGSLANRGLKKFESQPGLFDLILASLS